MSLISYGVSATEKAEIEAYAKEKGLKDSSALARFAVARYMAQYPSRQSSASLAGEGRPNKRGVPPAISNGDSEARP